MVSSSCETGCYFSSSEPALKANAVIESYLLGFFSFHFCNTKASSCLASGWSCLLWVDLHSVSSFTSLLTFFMLALLLHDWNRFAPVRKHFK